MMKENMIIPAIRVLTADPAWRFGDKLPGPGRGAEKHYETLAPWEIMRFPLPPIMDDAILFLWRVASMQQEALDVIKAWGFTLKSEIVWVKTGKGGTEDTMQDPAREQLKLHIGMGHYVRGAHETCLVATRGKFKVSDRGIRTVFFAPVGEHSAKPDAFYTLVEQLVGGEGPYAELFARKPRSSWHSFGNELPDGYVWTPRYQSTSPGVQIVVEAAHSTAVDADNFHSGMAEPENVTEDDLDFPAEPSAEGGFFDPATGEVFETLPSDAPASVTPALDEPKRRGRPKGSKNKLATADTVPAPMPSFAPTPVVTSSAHGPLPRHVIEDLGQHPSLVQGEIRIHFFDRAVADGLLPSVLVNTDPIEAWIQLQTKAPQGWFRAMRALYESAQASHPIESPAPAIPVAQPAPSPPQEPENIGRLALSLAKVGLLVSLVDLAAWTPTERAEAAAWTRGELKTFAKLLSLM